jgi:hypothetical protein
MPQRLRIIVSGMVAGDPHQGGATWAILQYALGFRQLGHDVFVIEPVARSTRRDDAPLAASISAAYFDHVIARFDLVGRAALLRQDTRETLGLTYHQVLNAFRDADLLVNISGMLTDRELFEWVPRRVYLDLDPAFNQLWHAVDGIDMRFEGHTHFVTVGAAIGSARCSIPTCGLPWLTTRQPVLLAEWPITAADAGAPWTTVGNWRGYGSIRHEGVVYGQKAHSLRRFIDLPRHVSTRIRLAMSIHPDEVNDLRALDAAGWELADPADVAGTPDAYQAFIQQSKGELAVAKSGYVESRCEWFSDRSVCYLASGRPVVAQDTGFGKGLPTGEGLLAFTTTAQAVEAIRTVEADYDWHCRRAREIAETYFNADVVLRRFLDLVASAARDSAVAGGGGRSTS